MGSPVTVSAIKINLKKDWKNHRMGESAGLESRASSILMLEDMHGPEQRVLRDYLVAETTDIGVLTQPSAAVGPWSLTILSLSLLSCRWKQMPVSSIAGRTVCRCGCVSDSTDDARSVVPSSVAALH